MQYNDLPTCAQRRECEAWLPFCCACCVTTCIQFAKEMSDQHFWFLVDAVTILSTPVPNLVPMIAINDTFQSKADMINITVQTSFQGIVHTWLVCKSCHYTNGTEDTHGKGTNGLEWQPALPHIFEMAGYLL